MWIYIELVDSETHILCETNQLPSHRKGAGLLGEFTVSPRVEWPQWWSCWHSNVLWDCHFFPFCPSSFVCVWLSVCLCLCVYESSRPDLPVGVTGTCIIILPRCWESHIEHLNPLWRMVFECAGRTQQGVGKFQDFYRFTPTHTRHVPRVHSSAGERSLLTHAKAEKRPKYRSPVAQVCGGRRE